jgi:hypothetical protein
MKSIQIEEPQVMPKPLVEPMVKPIIRPKEGDPFNFPAPLVDPTPKG